MLFNNTNMRTAMAYTNAVGDKVYPVIVDIKKGIKSTEEILFVSSDINTGILSVAFIQGNDTYNVAGAEVVCSVMRPDASTLDIPCTVIENNIVEVPLGVNGTSQDGIYSFDFKVFKGGNKVVGTPIMNYSVSLSISNDNVVLEDDRLPVLTMLMTQVSELKDEAREAINQANTATEATREATANAIEATNNANAVSERVSQETATAISEIKQDTANAIASMEQNTSTAISTMNQNTANAIANVNATSDTMVENVNNAISSMDTTVNNKISEMNTTVNNKISEVDTAKNDMINDVSSTKANMVTEVTNAKNEMTTTVTNKVNEVEGRFNALTASQQQSSEVIDARDGETSLKARLDRDIEKANKELDKIKKLEESTISTVETESDFTTVEATSNGYFEDVKLEGKTLVNLCTNVYDQKHSSVIDNGTSLNYTKHPNYAQCDFKLLQNLKQNTIYTVFLNVTNFVEDMRLQLNFYKYGDWVVCSNTEYIRAKGVHSILLTTTENIADHIRIGKMDSNVESMDEYITLSKDIIILEGDHTQNPPSYFEGLKSVGDGVDEIVVSSVKGDGNLFNGKWIINNIHSAISENFIPINRSKQYKIITDYNSQFNQINFKEYDNNFNHIQDSGYGYGKTESGIFTPSLNCSYVKIFADLSSKASEFIQANWKVQSVDIIDNIQYNSHQSDKKRLLYYNEETRTWEKPILRQWDSIEKHADGKYYYYQRSGEVVLNGSESWYVANCINDKKFFSVDMDGLPIPSGGTSLIINQICDRFAFGNPYMGEGDCAWVFTPSGVTEFVTVRIMLSSIEQTPSAIKSWLQANNVTVVYQLAQEKVYECTNIDLITYANETNYIVESGAIVPRTTLKVHNNISNVVRTLQEKVSLLENKFIMGLKQVLAGDMYSLAELLYPEDFVEENPENEIMLLPFE